jgi:LuxR family maltose regulon positive regulatory protein
MVHDAQHLLHHLKTDAPAWRTIALLTLGSSAQETGAKVVAEQALQEALAESQRAKSDYLQFLAYHNLILLNLQYGHLQQAEVLCRHFLHLAAHTPQKLLYHTLAHQYLGSIYLYRDEREQANAELQAGLQLSRDIHFRTAEMNILLRLVWLAITTGDLSTATAYSAELQQGRSRHEDKASSAFAAGHRAFLGSKLGDFGAVNHWLRQTDLQPEQFANEFSFNQFSDYVTWMHAQMATGKGGAKQVLRMMAQLKPYIYQRHNPQLSIEFGVFAACASFVLGDKEGALDSFAEAAALAEPEGYTFPFLLMGGKMPALINLAAQVNISPEFTQKLQNALQKNNQLNPLTPRENELLGLVSAGMSNEAIAQQTHVSINTVKAHLKRIHVKLNVKNRTSAVAEGKRLGII